MSRVESIGNQTWKITSRLPVPAEVSCYVIKREKITVIDCANASSISQQDLSEAFQEINIHPSTVDQIILTHCHMDHIGGLVAEKPLFSNAAVIACEGAAGTIEDFDYFHSIRQNVPNEEVFRQIVDEPSIRVMEQYFHRYRPLNVDREVKDGDSIDLGGVVLRVIETPGHSDSHISLLDEASGELFAGDIVSVGGPPALIVDLEQYLDSLAVLKSKPITVIYPGHGPVIVKPNETIDKAVRMIQGMEQTLLATIEKGSSALYDICLQMVKGEVDSRLRFFMGIVVPQLKRLEKMKKITMRDEEGKIDRVELVSAT